MSMKICESLSNPFDTAAEYEGENLFGSTDEGIGPAPYNTIRIYK